MKITGAFSGSDHSEDPLGAAVGFKNGLVAGVGIWIAAYVLFQLVGLLT